MNCAWLCIIFKTMWLQFSIVHLVNPWGLHRVHTVCTMPKHTTQTHSRLIWLKRNLPDVNGHWPTSQQTSLIGFCWNLYYVNICRHFLQHFLYIFFFYNCRFILQLKEGTHSLTLELKWIKRCTDAKQHIRDKCKQNCLPPTGSNWLKDIGLSPLLNEIHVCLH